MNTDLKQSWWKRNTSAITGWGWLLIASVAFLIALGAAASVRRTVTPATTAPSAATAPLSIPAPQPIPSTPSPAPRGGYTPPVSPWSYRTALDDMTGKTGRYAIVKSTNTVDFAFPYTGDQHGTLTVRSHPRHGQDVIFNVDKGQILCSSMDCNVMVRFDEGAPSRWSASEPADNSSEMIFLRNHAAFRQRLAKARELRIEVQFYQEGPRTFVFNVRGFDPKLSGAQ